MEAVRDSKKNPLRSNFVFKPNRKSKYSYTEIILRLKIIGMKITAEISIAIGRASSYWSQMRPPPVAKATKAGAPKMLFVEHWVAKIETVNAPGETPSLVTK